LRGPVDAPGIVEVLEGQVSYMGPEDGGWVALSELDRVVLTGPAGARVWRLMQADGQSLDLPTRAAGADRLFDVFAGLPGFDMAGALSALDSRQPVDRVLWSRTARPPCRGGSGGRGKRPAAPIEGAPSAARACGRGCPLSGRQTCCAPFTSISVPEM
jgi:hypothetical protein